MKFISRSISTSLRTVWLILFIVAANHSATAQTIHSTTIDSLLTVCDQLVTTEPARVTDIAEQIITVGKKENNILLLGKGNYYFGRAQRHSGNIRNALPYLEASVTMFKTIGEETWLCLGNKETGVAYYLLNENDKAMSLYTQALTLARKHSMQYEVIAINNNIGNLYDQQQHYAKAIMHYQECLRMKPDQKLRAALMANIGKAYLGQKLFDKAMKAYEESAAIGKTLKDPSYLINALNGITSVYWSEENDEAVLKASFKLLALEEKAGLTTDRIETLNRMGLSYLNLGKTHDAVTHFKKAMTLARQINYPRQHLIYANLAFAYEFAGDYKQAYQHLTRHKQLQDSIDNIENDKRLDELLAKYEADKKEQQIALLEQDKQLQELKLQTQRAELGRQALIRNSIIIIAFMLLIPALTLLLFYRQKMKSKTLLAAKTEEVNRQQILELIREHEIKTFKANLEGREKERERIAHELHDGVAGSLAGIKLHLVKVAEENRQTHLLEKAIRNIDGIYEEVRTLSHNLSPHAVLNTAFIDLLRNLLKQTEEHSAFSIEFFCYPEEKLNQLPDAIKIEVYRILQELMTNISRHAEATTVEVQFTQNEDAVNLLVEDTGKGFDITKVSLGLGLTSIKTRVHNIRGKIHVESAIGRGTIVNIDIPLPDLKLPHNS